MAIWLLTNFFVQLPKGFEEAAAIDGCGWGRTFFKIMLPLIKPATFSVGLLVFINCWNEYLYALTFMQDAKMRTVPVGIALLAQQLPASLGRRVRGVGGRHGAADRAGIDLSEENHRGPDGRRHQGIAFSNKRRKET